MHTVFVYGTLLDRRIMHQVCGTTLQSTFEATLSGYRRAALAGRSYPGILPDSSSTCKGKCYTGLTPEMLERLDHFEGSEYKRVLCEVINDDGKTLQAWSYVLANKAISHALEEDWNFETFQETAAARFIEEECPR